MIKKSKTNKRYLFWCYTNTGDEAWFEVATNKKTARENYAAGFGMDLSDVKSKLVCEISRRRSVKTGETITIDYLKEIGFEIVSDTYPAIVRLDGKVYKSGSFFEKMLEDKDLPKFPCVYFFKILETDRFKIGSTTDLIGRKLRIESQQAHHIHLKTFIETEEFKEVEYFIKKFLEKFRVKGDEWFRMDDFTTANVEVLFEIIRTEIKVEPLFHYKSELFKILIDQLKEIMNEHKLGTEPPNNLIEKLRVVYDINSKRKANLSHNVTPEEIIKLWSEHKRKTGELESIYLKKFCPYQLGDTITDEYQNKYKVEGREVYISKKDKTAKFYYSGTQLLKNGKEGKRFHNFITIKNKN
jgi:hypothetical protein